MPIYDNERERERGPLAVTRHSPPVLRDEGATTTEVSYVVMESEVGGRDVPIASHDDLESCEAHIIRLMHDETSVVHRGRARLFYSWVAVERYRAAPVE